MQTRNAAGYSWRDGGGAVTGWAGPGAQPSCTVIDLDGQIRAASRTSVSSDGAGSGLTSVTRPSSSWSKTSGAERTHWPAPTQLSGSTLMRTIVSSVRECRRGAGITGRGWSSRPADRQRVQPEQHAVVLERQVLQRHREFQGG